MTEYTLSNGSVAAVEDPKGRHMQKAILMAGGDQSLITPALMCQLVKIDGNHKTMEDFGDLPLKDYNVLMVAVLGEGK